MAKSRRWDGPIELAEEDPRGYRQERADFTSARTNVMPIIYYDSEIMILTFVSRLVERQPETDFPVVAFVEKGDLYSFMRANPKPTVPSGTGSTNPLALKYVLKSPRQHTKRRPLTHNL